MFKTSRRKLKIITPKSIQSKSLNTKCFTHLSIINFYSYSFLLVLLIVREISLYESSFPKLLMFLKLSVTVSHTNLFTRAKIVKFKLKLVLFINSRFYLNTNYTLFSIHLKYNHILQKMFITTK